jgi:hypothetical protein
MKSNPPHSSKFMFDQGYKKNPFKKMPWQKLKKNLLKKDEQ